MPVQSLGNANPPTEDPIANEPRKEIIDQGGEDKLAGTVTQPWVEWFNILSAQVQNSAFIQNSASFLAQSATLSPTDFTGGSLSEGLYRLTYYVKIDVAASVSSSLQIAFTWSDPNALSIAYSAMTGNTVTTGQSNTIMVHITQGSPVLITATYASVGTPMQYRLYAIIEELIA